MADPPYVLLSVPWKCVYSRGEARLNTVFDPEIELERTVWYSVSEYDEVDVGNTIVDPVGHVTIPLTVMEVDPADACDASWDATDVVAIPYDWSVPPKTARNVCPKTGSSMIGGVYFKVIMKVPL